MSPVLQWIVIVDPKRGAASVRRGYVIREHDNGRSHVAFVSADGASVGSADAPSACVHPTRELALAAVDAGIESWTADAAGPPPPCPYCLRERLLSTNLRLDVLRAAGMPADEVDRARASMERGEW